MGDEEAVVTFVDARVGTQHNHESSQLISDSSALIWDWEELDKIMEESW
jgi:hypothetical protein